MTFHTVYESTCIQDITGETIRPGGFDLTSRAMDYCRFSEKSLIVDAGCGNGASLRYIDTRQSLPMRLVGIDRSRKMMGQVCNEHPVISMIQADAGHLPCRNRIADGILCECALSLAEEKSQILSEFYRVLKKDGRLIITDIYARNPQYACPDNGLPPVSCINGAVSADTICGLIEDRGFEIVLWEDHTPYLKELAGNLIFAYGSMEKFWGLFCGSDLAKTFNQAAVRMKPGYYLLIVRKKEKRTCHV